MAGNDLKNKIKEEACRVILEIQTSSGPVSLPAGNQVKVFEFSFLFTLRRPPTLRILSDLIWYHVQLHSHKSSDEIVNSGTSPQRRRRKKQLPPREGATPPPQDYRDLQIFSGISLQRKSLTPISLQNGVRSHNDCVTGPLMLYVSSW